MKNILISILLAAGAMVSSAASAADSIGSGNYWNTECNGDTMSRFRCMVYVVGVIDGIRVAAAGYERKTPFCVPDSVTNGQMTDVFAKYLRDTPEKRHIPAAWLVSDALIGAFPCK